MLIDSTHSEETRVALLDGTKLEDLEIETNIRKQIKGNIYLAKVIRIEPSLQAAFVDYGGNKHGFLAFGEIHPDYYQIPEEDKEEIEKLFSEQAEYDAKRETERTEAEATTEEKEEAPVETKTEEIKAEQIHSEPIQSEETPKDENEEETELSDKTTVKTEDKNIETLSDDGTDIEAVEETPRRRRFSKYSLYHRYKIQEVIKEGQIMAIQVVKEERGNKGAALTTYLSLAGRYCVLMPNNGRSGGVSRKITNMEDRKKLKSIIKSLPMVDDMSLIVRTAGEDKNKAEITRDYNYLIRTWNNIREESLISKAPALIHEEGDLIKRSIRDIYTSDIYEILVAGETGYKTAKNFMKILTPSHVKRVKRYSEENIPLFHRYQVEGQIESLHSPIAQLPSGGYIVINPTEALVAIDVNSGEVEQLGDIEKTALQTNLESADEIARQLRMRNLAGLVVIDFIDMEVNANNHAVEKRMKEALKRDRARIQVGRISGFGLMELSRQRMHSTFLESSYKICPHCKGRGLIRSVESCAVHILRVLEDEGLKNRSKSITITVPTEVALYIHNNKRTSINNIEHNYSLNVTIEGDNTLTYLSDYTINRVKLSQQEIQSLRDNQKDEKEEKQLKDQPQEEKKYTEDEILDNEINGNLIEEPSNNKGRKKRENYKKGNFKKTVRTDSFGNQIVEEADIKEMTSEDGNNYNRRKPRKYNKKGRKPYNKSDNNKNYRPRNNNNTQNNSEPVVLYDSHNNNHNDNSSQPTDDKKKNWWKKIIS